MQAITNKQEPSPTKVHQLIKSHSDGEKGITPNPLPKIEHSNSSTQSESSMEPEKSTSLPQDIINDNSAEILDFVEMIHKERISVTPESLDSKIVKMLWDQNQQSWHGQNKSLDKTSQSHKKKGTENIAQVIADGIQDSDSNHVSEISATARRQNSDTISLLDLAQLFDKATNAEYYAMKANQEETLCWSTMEKNS
ncbi:8377_t:CDS:2 [Paraglomus brasilianum]|uniref:8377_t:CDS:1 n=1 Tax=Paraglomus brasilianum TaxID=144538 RepID=A0A9N9CWQ2_9GLOM|nr:8377_t:CDS:2 [Paraglomus brasilianum]